MNKFYMASAILAIASTSGFATAGTPGSFYMSADAGSTEFKGDMLDAAGTYTCGTITATVSVDDSDSGYGIKGGYNVTENFSLEVGYKNLGEISESASLSSGTCSTLLGTLTINSASTLNLTWEGSGYTIGGAFNYPINDKFSVGVDGGLFIWDVDMDVRISGSGSLVIGGNTYSASGTASGTESVDGEDMYFGLSAAYKIQDNLGIGLGYQRFNSLGGDNVGGDGDVDYMYAKLNYRF
jgi:hypothetical protein